MALWPAANVAGHWRAIVRSKHFYPPGSWVLPSSFVKKKLGVGLASCEQSETQETLELA